MWVEFSIASRGSSFVVTHCQPQDEEVFEVSSNVNSTEFTNWMIQKSKKTLAEICKIDKLKLNVKSSELHRFIYQAETVADRPSAPAPNGMGNVAFTAHQFQELMAALNTNMRQPTARQELVRPNNFDGKSESAAAWLEFYGYATERNGWNTDEEKIKNQRVFLDGIARKWYDSMIMKTVDFDWNHWREEFLAAFDENPVQLWERALKWEYRSGSTLEYYYEKQRLLALAEPNLPTRSLIALIIKGLPGEHQKQILSQNPTTEKELFSSIKNLTTDKKFSFPQQRKGYGYKRSCKACLIVALFAPLIQNSHHL